MNKLTVVKDQQVALFSNIGNFQGFYHVDSVSPKGTKIVVKREDGYTRTFNGNNIEQNEFSTKYRTDYIRTDIEAVKQEQSHQQQAIKVIGSLSQLSTVIPKHLTKYASKDSLQSIVDNIQKQLDETKQLIQEIN